MKRALALLLLCASLGRAQEGAADITSAVVDTDLRTLRGCPLKGVILGAEDWARVVDSLPGAPPAPDFARRSVALLVAEVPPGGESRLLGAERSGDDVRLVLHRKDPDPPRQGESILRCYFVFLPPFPGGVLLEHRTEVWGGKGFVSRMLLASPADRHPSRLPALGPDVRLSVAPPAGGALPAELFLRQEATFTARTDLPRRVTTVAWPGGGAPLGMRYPRLSEGVEHLFAAHGTGLRSRNPLLIKALPAPDGSGNPRPIVHGFQLEPVPE